MVDGEKNKWHSGVGDGVNCESLKVYYKQRASDSALMVYMCKQEQSVFSSEKKKRFTRQKSINRALPSKPE